MGVRAQIFWLQKAPVLKTYSVNVFLIEPEQSVPQNTWNFNLVFGKQPDAGLGVLHL